MADPSCLTFRERVEAVAELLHDEIQARYGDMSERERQRMRVYPLLNLPYQMLRSALDDTAHHEEPR